MPILLSVACDLSPWGGAQGPATHACLELVVASGFELGVGLG